jgi:signal transduction histidine kinase
VSPNDKPPESERQQTDESLRSERQKADEALGEDLLVIDDTADAVIDRARIRADELLAAARAKSDRQSAGAAQGAAVSVTTQKERKLADRVIREERADADEMLRVERAEHGVLLSIGREETDRDLLSERARSDDALAMRDEFLGVVSHELRNLLNNMILFAQLIAEGVLRDNHVEKVREHAQRIQRSGARMNRLIGDLVDVASIDAGALAVTPELLDPSHVVNEAVHTFQAQAAANQISLVTDVVPSSWLVTFDSARVLQVLVNLLSNALRFTPTHGKIAVHAERIADEIRFAVTDTGAGIPPEHLITIFDRFVQVNKEDGPGVGLGLYISRCIVQGHGGRIWVESEVGRGSTFYFTLPLAA